MLNPLLRRTEATALTDGSSTWLSRQDKRLQLNLNRKAYTTRELKTQIGKLLTHEPSNLNTLLFAPWPSALSVVKSSPFPRLSAANRAYPR